MQLRDSESQQRENNNCIVAKLFSRLIHLGDVIDGKAVSASHNSNAKAAEDTFVLPLMSRISERENEWPEISTAKNENTQVDISDEEYEQFKSLFNKIKKNQARKRKKKKARGKGKKKASGRGNKQEERRLTHPVGRLFLKLAQARLGALVYYYHEVLPDLIQEGEDKPSQRGKLDRIPDGIMYAPTPSLCSRANTVSKHSIANALLMCEWKKPTQENLTEAYTQSYRDHLNHILLSQADLSQTQYTYHFIGNGLDLKFLRIHIDKETYVVEKVKYCVDPQAIPTREEINCLIHTLVAICSVGLRKREAEQSTHAMEVVASPEVLGIYQVGESPVLRLSIDSRDLVFKEGEAQLVLEDYVSHENNIMGELEKFDDFAQYMVTRVEGLVTNQYVVTESFGSSLQVLSYKREFTREFISHVLASTSKALLALHEHGYSHNDIHPGNILVDHQNNVKLADFGSCGKLNTSIEEMGNTLKIREGFGFFKLLQLPYFLPAYDFLSLYSVVMWMQDSEFQFRSTKERQTFHYNSIKDKEWEKQNSIQCSNTLAAFFAQS